MRVESKCDRRLIIEVYVGKAASLSFLQLLRDTVTQHIGPSQFSHNVKSEDMLETESLHHIPPAVDDRLDVARKEAFIRAYLTAVSSAPFCPRYLKHGL